MWNDAYAIHRADTTDMPAITALVDAVFSGEQGIPREMNPVPAERQPQWWCAETDGTVIAALVTYRDAGVVHMGRIAVAPDMRGRGVGTQLLRRALSDVFAQGTSAVHMEARDATVRILEKMGARRTGEPFAFYGADCTPIVVQRECFRAE